MSARRAAHRAQPGTRRSTVVTIVAGAVTAATVGVLAVVSSGYHAERKDLGDGSVWIANGRAELVGRANTLVDELNSTVEAGGSDLAVAQRGDDVLVLDREHASLRVVDPADSSILDTVAMPPEVDAFAIAGPRLVIAADGEVWLPELDRLEQFDSTRDPALSLGPGTIVSVDDAGMLVAYRPRTGAVVRLDAARADTVQSRWQLAPVDDDRGFQLTSVAGAWALLDEQTGELRTADRSVALEGVIADRASARLQAASSRPGPVLVAHSGGLVAVGADGRVSVRADGRAGKPAAPFVEGDCSYAAWNDGTAVRQCAGEALVEYSLAMPGAPELLFRSNGVDTVLADDFSGRAWTASSGYDLIDNWDELEAIRRDDERIEEPEAAADPQVEKTQAAPDAVDDELGARPGRTTTLPLLVNDHDVNDDALVITAIDAVEPAERADAIDIVADGQAAQIALPADAVGTIRFRYTITDGHGGADSAVAAVTVRLPDVNGPPEQRRVPSITLGAGARTETNVLVDWVDPDGDPIFLVRADASGDDGVAYRADGGVTVTDRDGVGIRDLALLVSDGGETGSGSLELEVVPAGTAPLVAEPFVVTAAVGEDVEITPLVHVHGGSGPARLTAAPQQQDDVPTVDFEDGTFRFRSEAAGTHLLEYSVTDGAQTAAGIVRVEVTPALSRDTVPVTAMHTAFLQLRESADIDVLATDIDPTGGVLIVTGQVESSIPPGVKVEVVEHRLLRVTLEAPIEHRSLAFSYRVSNGLAEAVGSVTVVEVPRPPTLQPPIAVDDEVAVRAGDVIDVPVLENDRHPDDAPLALDPELVALPDAGLLFASGDSLRYLAPEVPGEYRAGYRVVAEDGQAATATLTIVVRAPDAATNTAPRPETVTARALAGETVRIRIPLGGIDADGDSVQLIGQASAPERGAVVASGPDWLDYTAQEYSEGTDQFEYAVVDASGARATGIVRVGIAARLDSASLPVAVEDSVTVRPGRTVAIRVLANDRDPDGGPLTIADVEPLEDAPPVELDGGVVRLTAPEEPGLYQYFYTVRNELAGSSQAFLSVEVDPDAPLPAPEADDTVLALDDVLGRSTVDVDVLEKVFFAEGDPRGLDVALVPGFTEGASVLADGAIRIEIGDRRRIVPFTVANPEDPSRYATALVRVPGRDDALPQLRRVEPPVVESGQELRIELADFVVTASGRPPRLATPVEVEASHGDGGELVVDSGTLRFRSEPGFIGIASISFAVTDARSADDPEGRTATLVLPVRVDPAVDQPPVFLGGRIDFEPGQTKHIDLSLLTSSPGPGPVSDLGFRLLEPRPAGFDFALDGRVLRITADEATPAGAPVSVSVAVRRGALDGTAGRIDLRVVPSTRPLAIAAADAAVAPRGRTTSVDVLANDEAGNPFPDTPLVVTAVRGLDRASLPDGVRIVASDDGSTLLVTVDPDAPPGDATVQYQVQDATGDAMRRVWGTATISVQDRPDPVGEVRVTGFDLGALDVAFEPGAANNSPISGYEIALVDPAAGTTVAQSACAETRCTVATAGEGRDHGVQVLVRARNAIGLSEPTAASGVYWSDSVPPAPEALAAAPLDRALRLSWTEVPAAGGSAVERYVITVGGVVDEFAASTLCTGGSCVLDWGGLANGQQLPVSVSARNQAAPEFAVWNSASTTGMPFGAPSAGGVAASGDAVAGTVTVAWDPFSGNGDPVLGYYVQRLSGDGSTPPTGSQLCDVTKPAPGQVVPPSTGGPVVDVVPVGPGVSSVTFSGVRDGQRDGFVVWGYNRAGCVRTELVGVVVRPAPGPVGPVVSDMRFTGSGLEYDRFVSSTGGTWTTLVIRAVGADGTVVPGSERAFAGTGWPRAVLDRPFGESVRFQLRGCSVWGSCGPWSDILPPDARPSLTFDVPNLRWDAASATWTWTGDPDNSGIPASYRCGAGADETGRRAHSPGSCTVEGVGPDGAAWLDVQIGGVTARIANG